MFWIQALFVISQISAPSQDVDSFRPGAVKIAGTFEPGTSRYPTVDTTSFTPGTYVPVFKGGCLDPVTCFPSKPLEEPKELPKRFVERPKVTHSKPTPCICTEKPTVKKVTKPITVVSGSKPNPKPLPVSAGSNPASKPRTAMVGTKLITAPHSVPVPVPVRRKKK